MKKKLSFTSIFIACLYFFTCNSINKDLNDHSGIHLLNAQRTGYISTNLSAPFQLDWVYTARHQPSPAWKEPAWEIQRIDQDYAYPLSVGNGLVYYSSSTDHALHALDLKTGKEKWCFFTQAPLRFAPAIDGNRIYLASDDGRIYCLDGRLGKKQWSFRPNIPDERLIGNEQMMSRWPARSGVLVDRDKLYTAFGMWSPEGIFLYCLDPKTGSVIWQNDDSGSRYETFPHFRGMGGVSPHGYLARTRDVLVVPNGRATPALFDINTGKLLYHEAEGLFPGGSWTMTYDDLVFVPCPTLHKPNPVRPERAEANIGQEATLVALEAKTGQEVFHLMGALKGVIADNGTMTLIGPDRLISVDLALIRSIADTIQQQRIRNSVGHFIKSWKHCNWQVPAKRLYTLVHAGQTVIAGGQNVVNCFDSQTGQKVGEYQVEGQVRELLVTPNAVLASTTLGKIYCFRPGTTQNKTTYRNPDSKPVKPADKIVDQAARILSAAKHREGYCLVLGETNVDLMTTLAKQSNMTIYHPTQAHDLNQVRLHLNRAGLYGKRIALHPVSGQTLPYTDYFADVIVMSITSKKDLDHSNMSEFYRLLRPCGGVAVIRFPDDMGPQISEWLDNDTRIAGNEWNRVNKNLIRIERGALPGAGEWTHQYANPGKTSASDDQRIRLPLKVLWFGGMGPAKAVSRHYRTPAPLVVQGRVFVPGTDHVVAMNAYNGRIMWERRFPGVGHWPAPHRGGSLVADANAVYVFRDDTCLKLDPVTGQTLHTFQAPVELISKRQESNRDSSRMIWEYGAIVGDYLIGSLGNPHVQRSWWSYAKPANYLLFVLHKQTGQLLWNYQPEKPLTSSGIAVDDGRIFIIEGQPRFYFLKANQPEKRLSKERAIKALDLKTGKQMWQTTIPGQDQCDLWVSNGVLVATITSNTHIPVRLTKQKWSKYYGHPGLEAPQVSAFSAQTGELLWSKAYNGPCSPVIVDDVLYLPEAFDLRTGRAIQTRDPLTGRAVHFAPDMMKGCAKYAGCPNLLMTRSGSLGFYDLAHQSGLYQYRNVRASCWINMIPAGGLIVVPEGSSSCPCAYTFKTSLALVPDNRRNHWGIYGRMPDAGKWTDATQLRINFGAPGDRADGQGNLWFAYPRPSSGGPDGGGGMADPPNTELPIQILQGKGTLDWFRFNPDWHPIQGTDKPWLFTSGSKGNVRIRIQLGSEQQKPKAYRVTLYFCELENLTKERFFNIKINDKVLSQINVSKEAGGTNHALIKEFAVKSKGEISLKVLSQDKHGPPPVINAIEVLLESNDNK
jgi:outer membrane protein assembly factor BamB